MADLSGHATRVGKVVTAVGMFTGASPKLRFQFAGVADPRLSPFLVFEIMDEIDQRSRSGRG